MAAVAEKPIDKSDWGDGPWQTEPDRREWKHAGFPCLIVRVAGHGALCGYVAVPPGHPWHGKSYNELDVPGVHGGLTYSDKCHGAVCHVPAPGEPDDVWWMGFDHAHCDDLCPARDHTMFMHGDGMGATYRDMNYAIQGVCHLARCARDAAAAA